MKVIGVLGMLLREFNDWCRKQGFKRQRVDTYFDEKESKQYICLTNNSSIIGRIFDEVLDINPYFTDPLMKQECIKRTIQKHTPLPNRK